MMSTPKLLAIVAAAACCAGSAAAQSPAYPSRAVTLIVPFPAGGGVDAVARLVAEQ
jgi:tripartite-type tricarboxylate transporter receptor subunit TctC